MFYCDYCLLLFYIILHYGTAFFFQNKEILREVAIFLTSFLFSTAGKPVNIQMFVILFCFTKKSIINILIGEKVVNNLDMTSDFNI